MSDEPEKPQDESTDDYINRTGRATNRRPDPQGFYEWLDRLRELAPMYFGEKSLYALFCWMEGFRCGKQNAGIDGNLEQQEFNTGFGKFFDTQLGLSQMNLNWLSKIRARTLTDKQAFDEFFRLLDEFRESNRKAREREAKREAKAAKVE